MPLRYRVLGLPARDNALLVDADTGQGTTRLLFDCGSGTLAGLDPGDIAATDHLFFSHLHMDHVGGFDDWFRCVFERTARPNHIWGPPGTADIIQHRFRGFWWNIRPYDAVWRVHDIHADRLATSRFLAREAFAHAHAEADVPLTAPFVSGPGFGISAVLLEHRGPCVGYIVREPERVNVDPTRLVAAGLPPGSWLKRLRDPSDTADAVEVAGRTLSLAALRADLLVRTPGDSVAYLTDFGLPDDAEIARVAEAVRGCGVIVCESQYRAADADLADDNHHLTCERAASLAAAADAGRLVLFHVSARYAPADWRAMLAEARAIFPATHFPDHWGIDP